MSDAKPYTVEEYSTLERTDPCGDRLLATVEALERVTRERDEARAGWHAAVERHLEAEMERDAARQYASDLEQIAKNRGELVLEAAYAKMERDEALMQRDAARDGMDALRTESDEARAEVTRLTEQNRILTLSEAQMEKTRTEAVGAAFGLELRAVRAEKERDAALLELSIVRDDSNARGLAEERDEALAALRDVAERQREFIADCLMSQRCGCRARILAAPLVTDGGGA